MPKILKLNYNKNVTNFSSNKELSLNQLDKISGGAKFLMFLKRYNNAINVNLYATEDIFKREVLLSDFPNLYYYDLDNLGEDKILVVRYKELDGDIVPVSLSIKDIANINGINYTDMIDYYGKITARC